ncbi:Acetate CoA-transferase subunit alpha [Thalassovita gelatinovora]|uniref:Acetate CoA-transferase subunit alpha n=1 Tax=Thalassovita gelatinovora TaxID=53501 RepID=A0A0P1G298_THAGE|nr:CoA transferase subunit A [Thalassovita gelatinovora]QIZ82188.1 CoA transferase subunit A [Thalassovita gelatinovora]CUH67814.1 Acetate CoA-transferase subunit alpha [Thalassovita gelatinovora]SEP66851.1 6-acetamido-3-oxohexanoate:acetyl-CoA CoA transferase alpha subunit [Thalassovita gelatinovora]
MRLPDKTTTIEDALAGIADGATVMIGGFGVPGTPFTLIHELVRQGAQNLTVIKNDANETDMGVDHLLASGQVARLITTHIGLNPRAMALMNEGRLEVEFNAQGILAERVRAGGAGLGGILTDIAEDTELAEGKQTLAIDGKSYIVETALRADVALIHANRADAFGNLDYVATARNFNPLMAMAASRVIAEAEQVLPMGGLSPDDVHTPGPFVDHVVELTQISEEYAIVRR